MLITLAMGLSCSAHRNSGLWRGSMADGSIQFTRKTARKVRKCG